MRINGAKIQDAGAITKGVALDIFYKNEEKGLYQITSKVSTNGEAATTKSGSISQQ
ncbi:MAG: hypothetical protein U5L01_05495 [Rheinheimera sp.]|nr:hypothetical protein [Rheinheimera sp.]